ncbi:hypothetical protein BmR1_04g08955 [Babesia microti strain RI]|uniref:Uncharacterized protein n=1 Tax=Babesia microti (strain RI) TaxID=1133968 RepID=A0A1N6LYC8_BABMR|nr:hypothetical protein BmR1_04g08955 [Babesia microti strain RI]SIO73854.1 hypothetical protein BmR1_04g08955 [Babesia microti strain RI]|eukprot:XP_021337907.1 hypothetical protein BmR1_04g08955 [Babesia microti strain RI]
MNVRGRSEKELVIKYVQCLQKHLNDSNSDEDKLLLCLNCLEEIKGKELAVAIDAQCSKVLESISEILARVAVSGSTDEKRTNALKGFNSLYSTMGWAVLSLAGDSFGSHILESLISLSIDLKKTLDNKFENTIIEGMFSMIQHDDSWIKMVQHFAATHVIRKLVTFAILYNKSLLNGLINDLVNEISTEIEFKKSHESILSSSSSAATICYIIDALSADKPLQSRLIGSIFNYYRENLDNTINYLYVKKSSNRILETSIAYLDTEHLDIICNKWFIPYINTISTHDLGNFLAQKIIQSFQISPSTFYTILQALSFHDIINATRGAVIWKTFSTAARLSVGCKECLDKLLTALNINLGERDKHKIWHSLFQLKPIELLDETQLNISQTACSILIATISFPKTDNKLLALLKRFKSFLKSHKRDGFIEKLSTHSTASRVLQAIVDPRNKCPPKVVNYLINVFISIGLIEKIYTNLNGSFLICSIYQASNSTLKGLILKQLSTLDKVHPKLSTIVGLDDFKHKHKLWEKGVKESEKAKKLFKDLL